MSEAEYINEICALRARLAEVEAERDERDMERVTDMVKTPADLWMKQAHEFAAEVDRLRARLAEVEARCVRQYEYRLAETVKRYDADARLAAVEALCMRSEWAEWPFAKKVLTAARGESDQ